MPRKPANPTRDIPRGAGWLSAAIEVTEGHWKCQARWRDGARYRAKSFHGPTRQAVLDAGSDYLRIVSRQKRDGRTVAAIDLTVEDAVNQWLERRASSWKDATYATYRQRARTLVLPHLGILRVTDLDAPRIQAWIDTLHRSGVAGNTIASASMVLSGAMKELVRLGVLPANPAAGGRLPTSGVTPHQTWDTAEIQVVLGYVAREPIWNAVYRLALFTGLRPGELQALKWSDVDLDAGTITPQVTMTKDRQGRVVVGTTTKTGRPRVITIPASVVSALRVWRTRQKEQRIAAVTWDSRTFVFTTRTGRYIAQSSWQKVHRRIIRETGVKAVTMHELRHTFATLLLGRNVSPKIVSEMLGHKDIETTLNIYSHVSVDLQRTASEALERHMADAVVNDNIAVE